jgi:hypothetical protein
MLRVATVASCLVLAACGEGASPAPPETAPTPHVRATLTFVDADGRAIKSASLMPRAEALSMELKFERFAEADSTGKATLPDLEPARTYALNLFDVPGPLLDWSPAESIPSEAGTAKDWQYGSDVKIPRWKPIDTAFRFAIKSVVKGRVIDRDGHPVTGVTVVADWTPAESDLNVPCDGHGEFEIHGFRGTPTVELKVFGAFSAPLAAATWRPQKQPVELSVDPGATLSAHASRMDGAVLMSAKERSPFHRARYDAVRFVGLAAAERYTVWVAPDRGRYGLLENVAADGKVHEVPLIAGDAIRGTVTWPNEVNRMAIEVVAERGLLQATADVDSSGTFLIDGLPPGDWTLTATVADKPALVARGVAAPGGDVVSLRLAPR